MMLTVYSQGISLYHHSTLDYLALAGISADASKYRN